MSELHVLVWTKVDRIALPLAKTFENLHVRHFEIYMLLMKPG